MSIVLVEYVSGGKRDRVRFRLGSDGDFELLKEVFEMLANGTRSNVSLVKEKTVLAPSTVQEIELQLVDVEKRAMPWVRIRTTASGRHEISWRRDREGWKECLELFLSLTPGTHQYFNYSDTSGIEVEMSFLEG